MILPIDIQGPILGRRFKPAIEQYCLDILTTFSQPLLGTGVYCLHVGTSHKLKRGSDSRDLVMVDFEFPEPTTADDDCDVLFTVSMPNMAQISVSTTAAVRSATIWMLHALRSCWKHDQHRPRLLTFDLCEPYLDPNSVYKARSQIREAKRLEVCDDNFEDELLFKYLLDNLLGLNFQVIDQYRTEFFTRIMRDPGRALLWTIKEINLGQVWFDQLPP